jgi:hypothetical protein
MSERIGQNVVFIKRQQRNNSEVSLNEQKIGPLPSNMSNYYKLVTFYVDDILPCLLSVISKLCSQGNQSLSCICAHSITIKQVTH